MLNLLNGAEVAGYAARIGTSYRDALLVSRVRIRANLLGRAFAREHNTQDVT